jgi:MFS family permease
MPTRRPNAFLTFSFIWFGQVISLIGTALSGFALTIWAWELTGSATSLALVGFFNFGPTVIFSPIAGALVDRWNKKWVMMFSDLASGLSTILIFILFSQGKLQIWHLYAAGAFSGTFQAFQWPAYSTAITVMVPKAQYSRAASMMSLADWGSGIFGPVLAGALIGVIGIGNILLIDIATFIIAIAILLVSPIPPVPVSEEGRQSRGSLWKESVFGFKYIWQRPSLLGLQLMFFAGNLMGSLTNTLISPMILGRTGNNAQMLGLVQSIGSAGGVAGALLMSAWGGPKKRVNGVIYGWLLSGLLGQIFYGTNFSPTVWMTAAFVYNFFFPMLNASNQAIWQSKVPPDLQGRVFAIRRLIAQITVPVAMLSAGPLADLVFEPALQNPHSFLSSAFGWVVGGGIGSGMGLIIIFSGIGMACISLAGWLVPAIRNVDTILPDHDAAPSAQDR